MGQDLLPGHQEWCGDQKDISHRESGGGGVQIRQSGIPSFQGQCEKHQWMVQGLDGVVNEMKEKEQSKVSEDLIQEADRLWENPRMIMNLIDLLFLWDDPDKKQIPS